MMIDETSESRHLGPVTEDERAFCAQVARMAHARKLPFGRAVFLFGYMASTMVRHAVEKHGADPADAMMTYFHHFATGAGMEVTPDDDAAAGVH
jgi:hypothetical protein